MRVTLYGTVILISTLAVAGCCKSNEETNPPPTTTAATPPVPAADSFAGTYTSNWGSTTFRQSGTSVTATYPRGNMTCVASGDTLDCTWYEGAATGKARLFKMTNGDIKGTWGSGSSSTNGGPWLFKRKF